MVEVDVDRMPHGARVARRVSAAARAGVALEVGVEQLDLDVQACDLGLWHGPGFGGMVVSIPNLPEVRSHVDLSRSLLIDESLCRRPLKSCLRHSSPVHRSVSKTRPFVRNPRLVGRDWWLSVQME